MSRLSATADSITSKLFKKGDGLLYHEGLYTLSRDDHNDYQVAFATEKASSTSARDSGRESTKVDTGLSHAQVLKIQVTNEARLEFEIITQNEVPAQC